MKQIIAIGGGGFGREIKDLKIEKYIVQLNRVRKLNLKSVLSQQLQVMIHQAISIISIRLSTLLACEYISYRFF